MRQAAPEARALGPIQELAEAIDLIIVAAAGKALQLALKFWEPMCLAREQDIASLNRGTGRVETDFLVLFRANKEEP